MKRVKKLFLWFGLLNKRLLKKISFLCLLACIPLLVMGVNLMAQQDSGVLRIALSREDEEDALAAQAMDRLMQRGSMVQYVVADSPEQARSLVVNGQADGAWIVREDLQDNIDE